MDRLIFGLYQYFFGKNQRSAAEDHSIESLVNMMEECNSILTSTIKSTNSIEMHPSQDETNTSSTSTNLRPSTSSLTVKSQDIDNQFSEQRNIINTGNIKKDVVEYKSKDIAHINNQNPHCTELFKCLQNTVKELEGQKLMYDKHFKGLTLNLNNNNIRLVAVENDVNNLILKCMDLSQMYGTLQDQIECVSGNISAKVDLLEQLLSQNMGYGGA